MKKCVLVAVTAFLILVGGCTSGEKSVREGEKRTAVTTLSEWGIDVSVQYLDRKILYDRFGTRNNPFFEYAGDRLIVIEFTMSTENDVRLRIMKIIFDYLNSVSVPVSRVDFSQYWEQTLRNPGAASTGVPNEYRDWSYNQVLKVINENTLPDSLELEPGHEYRGLMLFKGSVGRYGTARITVPFYAVNGKKLHEFVFLVDI